MKDLPTDWQTRRVSIDQIAREAGVSLTTFSRTLNDRPDIKPDTGERTLSIAQELGHTPSLPVRNPVTRDTASIYPHSMSTDILSGSQQAMDHLIGLGHRRVAYIGTPYGHNANLNRLAGYTKTLTQHSIPPDERIIAEGNGAPRERAGYAAIDGSARTDHGRNVRQRPGGRRSFEPWPGRVCAHRATSPCWV